MSLPTDAAPRGHLPPAATAPWPLQPPPHGASAYEIPVHPVERQRDARGWIGALVAAAVGLAVAAPLILFRKSRATRRRRGSAKA